MDVPLIRMSQSAERARAGAHCSDGWDVDTPWHQHDLHQCVYAFEGALEIEGEAGRYIVPRQFAAWIPAGTAHRTKIQKLASGSVFFEPEMIACPPGALRILPVSSLMREMIFYAMRWPIERPADATGEAYFDCLAALFAEWIEQEAPLLLPTSADARIKAAMEYTRVHVASASFDAACAAAGMSARSLRRRFKDETGMSWEEFRRRQRLCLAIDALDFTTKPVGVIAAEIGYENQAAFAKAFRAMMGLSPSEYRKARR